MLQLKPRREQRQAVPAPSSAECPGLSDCAGAESGKRFRCSYSMRLSEGDGDGDGVRLGVCTPLRQLGLTSTYNA